jgi:cytochrome c5
MKNIIRIGLTLLVLSATLAHAQSGGSSAADVGAGKKRAAACFACHNADGISKIPGTPHLAGQDRAYLENALRAYRDGQTRQNPTMNAMAKPLSDRDITNIAAYFSLQVRMGTGQTASQMMETLERIKPVGSTAPAQTATAPNTSTGNTSSGAAAVRSGEAVYNSNCSACHASGAAGAPKLGDKAEWAPRLAQGTPTLVQHALQGFKGMPAKGACTNCSEAEIKSAVEHLAAKSK